jgi:hypothetical protein
MKMTVTHPVTRAGTCLFVDLAILTRLAVTARTRPEHAATTDGLADLDLTRVASPGPV